MSQSNDIRAECLRWLRSSPAWAASADAFSKVILRWELEESNPDRVPLASRLSGPLLELVLAAYTAGRGADADSLAISRTAVAAPLDPPDPTEHTYLLSVTLTAPHKLSEDELLLIARRALKFIGLDACCKPSGSHKWLPGWRAQANVPVDLDDHPQQMPTTKDDTPPLTAPIYDIGPSDAWSGRYFTDNFGRDLGLIPSQTAKGTQHQGRILKLT